MTAKTPRQWEEAVYLSRIAHQLDMGYMEAES